VHQLVELEIRFPGITASIAELEAATLPSCPACRSVDTATVHVGVIDRLLAIAAATTKLKLVPEGPVAGVHYCNACRRFF
jgi:hypothetical protein